MVTTVHWGLPTGLICQRWQRHGLISDKFYVWLKKKMDLRNTCSSELTPQSLIVFGRYCLRHLADSLCSKGRDRVSWGCRRISGRFWLSFKSSSIAHGGWPHWSAFLTKPLVCFSAHWPTVVEQQTVIGLKWGQVCTRPTDRLMGMRKEGQHVGLHCSYLEKQRDTRGESKQGEVFVSL